MQRIELSVRGLRLNRLFPVVWMLLSACASQPPTPNFANPLANDQCYTGYILYDPRYEGENHSAWAIPVEVIKQYDAQLPLSSVMDLSQSDYILLEWGERKWWLENDENAFRTLFVPSEGILGISGFSATERELSSVETSYEMQLTAEEMHRLMAYFIDYFARDK